MSLTTARTDRGINELRPLGIEIDVAPNAEGSALINTGNTRIWCTASVEESVPRWLEASGQGWVTAEYSLLPRSTNTRISRHRAKDSGRSREISRLIGRSLRAGIDMKALGARTITIDCDVLQADGGTRTAAITGGFVALALACQHLTQAGTVRRSPIRGNIAAVSVGIVAGEIRLDLDYKEDTNADVDMNIVMDSQGRYVEIQGNAEQRAFSREQLNEMLDLAGNGIPQLIELQKQALGQSATR